MKYRKLGHGSLEISIIGLGRMGMSEFYGASNETESILDPVPLPFHDCPPPVPRKANGMNVP